MLRRLILLILALTILFGVLAVFSIFIGRNIDPSVVLALSAPRRVRNGPEPIYTVMGWDLDRSLRIDSPIPMTYVRRVDFDYRVPNYIHVVTYEGNTRAKEYKAGFHEYNYVSGELTTVDIIEADHPIGIGSDSYSYFSLFSSRSADGRKLTYLHPLDKKPYVFDTVTGETRLIADQAVSSAIGLNAIRWSPDGTQVAVVGDNAVGVFRADGSQQLEYELDTAPVNLSWSQDSQYIILQRYMLDGDDPNHPIEIIHAADGTEHPLTEGLSGDLHTWWGCEGKWLTYSASKGPLREAYLLNMHNGQAIRLNDDPLLADKNISYVNPLGTGCDMFAVIVAPQNTIESFTPGRLPSQSFYLYDLSSETIQYIGETLNHLLNGNTLYYETVDEETGQHQIISRTLNPSGESIVGEPVVTGSYPPPSASWLLWDDDMSDAVYHVVTSNYSTTGQLDRINPRTGQIYRLTSDDDVAGDIMMFSWNQTHDQQ